MKIFCVAILCVFSLSVFNIHAADNRIPIHVKLDGTWDFTEIQAAINSISDASEAKPYVVYVHDDMRITDLTRLWMVHAPRKVAAPKSIHSQVALITTKSWVDVVGVGDQKVLEIVSPQNLPASVYQYIQVIYPRGNCLIENFKFIITGGRYAIHQESGGSKTHMDYHTTTTYKDIYAEHKGNQGYPEGAWKYTNAQANGTTSGTTMIHINCEWKSNNYPPYYTHTNKEFDAPNTLVFENCKMHIEELRGVRWLDLGSGQKTDIRINNSDFTFFEVQNQIRRTEKRITNADLWENGGAVVRGSGNRIMTAIEEVPATLYFTAKKASDDIRITGGDAAELIVGGELKHQAALPDTPGAFWGRKRIQDNFRPNSSNVFTMQHRLGNCVANPKTLKLKVGDKAITILFDKNYVTTNNEPYEWNTKPAVSTGDMIRYINKSSHGLFRCGLNTVMRIYSFSDCMATVRNKTSTTFKLGSGLVHDPDGGENAYRLCRAGEVPHVIAAERIDAGDLSRLGKANAIIFDKAIFRGAHLGLSGLKAGSLVASADNGRFTLTTDPSKAIMKAIDKNFVRFIERSSE